MRKGQYAIEYMVITIVLLMLLLPIYYTIRNQQIGNVLETESEKAVQDLKNSIERAYSLGPGTREFVYFRVPQTMTSIDLQENLFSMSVASFTGTKDTYAYVTPDLLGSLPNEAGTYKIEVLVLDNKTVHLKVVS